MSIPLSPKAQSLPLGIYEHYKGNRYRVLGVAHHSETLEELVVYQKLYDDRGIWVRPLDMFVGEVEVEGKNVVRFKYIDNKEK